MQSTGLACTLYNRNIRNRHFQRIRSLKKNHKAYLFNVWFFINGRCDTILSGCSLRFGHRLIRSISWPFLMVSLCLSYPQFILLFLGPLSSWDWWGQTGYWAKERRSWLQCLPSARMQDILTEEKEEGLWGSWVLPHPEEGTVRPSGASAGAKAAARAGCALLSQAAPWVSPPSCILETLVAVLTHYERLRGGWV